MEVGTSPLVVSSSKRIMYRASAWRVEQFEVERGGELVCRGAALWLRDSLLVWVGGADARLTGVALGVPGARTALATALTGEAGDVEPLARRLAAALARPVYMCCGLALDRITAPLVEQALISLVKKQSTSS